MMAKPMKTLELYYPMIHFVIIYYTSLGLHRTVIFPSTIVTVGFSQVEMIIVIININNNNYY